MPGRESRSGMPSSRRVRLAAEARDDLRDVLQYSLEVWGRPQCDAYRTAILRRLAEVADFPRLGRPRDDLFAGCRSRPIRQHIVSYRMDVAEIIVVRILHEWREPIGAVVPPEPR